MRKDMFNNCLKTCLSNYIVLFSIKQQFIVGVYEKKK
jgi:hypothetical protein